jgi:hypothetical protein
MKDANFEIYNNARKILEVPGSREDLYNVARQLRDNKNLVFEGYSRRDVPVEEWDGMYSDLLKAAFRRAESQEQRSNKAKKWLVAHSHQSKFD